MYRLNRFVLLATASMVFACSRGGGSGGSGGSGADEAPQIPAPPSVAQPVGPSPSPLPAPSVPGVPSPAACGSLAHGESSQRVRYQSASVPHGSVCVSQIQTATCNNGAALVFSGNYSFQSCVVAAPGSCVVDGVSFASGANASRTRYQSASAFHPGTCAGEVQNGICDNGAVVFDGSYQETTCRQYAESLDSSGSKVGRSSQKRSAGEYVFFSDAGKIVYAHSAANGQIVKLGEIAESSDDFSVRMAGDSIYLAARSGRSVNLYSGEVTSSGDIYFPATHVSVLSGNLSVSYQRVSLEAYGSSLYVAAVADDGFSQRVSVAEVRDNGSNVSSVVNLSERSVRGVLDVALVNTGSRLALVTNSDTVQIYQLNGSSWENQNTSASADELEGLIPTNDVTSSIYAAVRYRGELYIAGNFVIRQGNMQVTHFAKWDGTAWVSPPTKSGSSIIHAMAVHNDLLYLAGTFTTIGGITAQRLASFNGETYATVGGVTGLNNSVTSLAVYGGSLYVGGQFTCAFGATFAGAYPNNTCSTGPVMARIARLDDSTGLLTSVGSGLNNVVNTMAAHNGSLYVGGTFTSPSPGVYFARWDGSNWHSVSGSMSAQVRSLLSAGTDLYVGGNFHTVGALTVNRIARLDDSGNWHALGQGLDQPPTALAFKDGALFASGSFSNDVENNTTLSGVARFEGGAWHALGTGVDNVFTQTTRQIYVEGEELFFLGNHELISGVYMSGGGVYSTSSSSWRAMFPPRFSGSVYGGVVYQGRLVVGGRFEHIGGVAAKNIAAYNNGRWEAVGSGLSMAVFAVALHKGELFAGGEFDCRGDAQVTGVWPTLGCTSGDYYGKLARFNGTDWVPHGAGVGPHDVRALASYGEHLAVGGQFEVPQMNVMKVADDGTYSALLSSPVTASDEGVRSFAVAGDLIYMGGGFTVDGVGQHLIKHDKDSGLSSRVGGGVNYYVKSLTLGGGGLYIGGSFRCLETSTIDHTNLCDVGPTFNHVAFFDGVNLSSLGDGVDQPVEAVAFHSGSLFVSGSFTHAGGLASSGFASYDGSSWTTRMQTQSVNNIFNLASISFQGREQLLILGGWNQEAFSGVGNTPLRIGGVAVMKNGLGMFGGSGLSVTSSDNDTLQIAVSSPFSNGRRINVHEYKLPTRNLTNILSADGGAAVDSSSPVLSAVGNNGDVALSFLNAGLQTYAMTYTASVWNVGSVVSSDRNSGPLYLIDRDGSGNMGVMLTSRGAVSILLP